MYVLVHFDHSLPLVLDVSFISFCIQFKTLSYGSKFSNKIFSLTSISDYEWRVCLFVWCFFVIAVCFSPFVATPYIYCTGRSWCSIKQNTSLLGMVHSAGLAACLWWRLHTAGVCLPRRGVFMMAAPHCGRLFTSERSVYDGGSPLRASVYLGEECLWWRLPTAGFCLPRRGVFMMAAPHCGRLFTSGRSVYDGGSPLRASAYLGEECLWWRLPTAGVCLPRGGVFMMAAPHCGRLLTSGRSVYDGGSPLRASVYLGEECLWWRLPTAGVCLPRGGVFMMAAPHCGRLLTSGRSVYDGGSTLRASAYLWRSVYDGGSPLRASVYLGEECLWWRLHTAGVCLPRGGVFMMAAPHCGRLLTSGRSVYDGGSTLRASAYLGEECLWWRLHTAGVCLPRGGVFMMAAPHCGRLFTSGRSVYDGGSTLRASVYIGEECLWWRLPTAGVCLPRGGVFMMAAPHCGRLLTSGRSVYDGGSPLRASVYLGEECLWWRLPTAGVCLPRGGVFMMAAPHCGRLFTSGRSVYDGGSTLRASAYLGEECLWWRLPTAGVCLPRGGVFMMAAPHCGRLFTSGRSVYDGGSPLRASVYLGEECLWWRLHTAGVCLPRGGVFMMAAPHFGCLFTSGRSVYNSLHTGTAGFLSFSSPDATVV